MPTELKQTIDLHVLINIGEIIIGICALDILGVKCMNNCSPWCTVSFVAEPTRVVLVPVVTPTSVPTKTPNADNTILVTFTGDTVI